ncbi:MAG: tetratricopeptide repeat protein [Planctomyces sp.]|nr:tetratricopeptide repeat protein [Planctomyces sp.]
MILLIACGSVLSLLAAIALFRDRRSPEDHFNSALAALNRGDAAGVDEAFQILERRPGFEDHARLLDAVLFLRGGRPDAALRSLSQIPTDGPLRRDVMLYTAQALHAQQRVMEAWSILQDLVAEHPDDVDGHRWLGAIYYDLGANDAAVYYLKRVSELAPDDYRPHHLLGLIASDFEDFPTAAAHFRKLLELDPPDELRRTIPLKLARALFAMREYDQIQTLLRDAPESAESLALLAWCSQNEGDLDTARSLMDAALALDPQQRDALLVKVDLISLDGDPEDVLQLLQEAVAAHPYDQELRYRLALQYRRLGREEEHEAELAAWNSVTERIMKLSNLNREAIARPTDPDVRDQLADVCESLGKADLAKMWREAADACRRGLSAASASAPAGDAGSSESPAAASSQLPPPAEAPP